MLRFPSEAELNAFLAKSNARIMRPLGNDRDNPTKVAVEPKPKKEKKAPKVKIPRPRSDLEIQMERQFLKHSIPEPEREYRFESLRKWRFDFAWPSMMLAMEVEGSVHRIKGRFKSDIEKYAIAQLNGWTVLRVARNQIKDGRAIIWLETLIRKARGL